MLSISFNDFFLSFQAPNEVRDSADAFSAPRGFIARLGSHTTCPKRGGGSYATPLEPLVAPALQRSAVVVAALSAMLIFMGGLPTMISSILLVQARPFVETSAMAGPLHNPQH